MEHLKNILATVFLVIVIYAPIVLVPIAILLQWHTCIIIGLLMLAVGDAAVIGTIIYTEYVDQR